MGRLKGLDEFEAPAFVGRMERVARRQRVRWWMTLGAAFLVGVLLGLLLI